MKGFPHQVCNHPDLFEPRPVSSPFRMTGLVYTTASLVLSALSYDPFKVLSYLFILLAINPILMENNST